MPRLVRRQCFCKWGPSKNQASCDGWYDEAGERHEVKAQHPGIRSY